MKQPSKERPTTATLAEALASSPDRLLALVAELAPEKRQQVIARALGLAIAELVRDEALPLAHRIIAEEAPGLVAKALDSACETYRQGYSYSLAEACREALRKAMTSSVEKRAAELVGGIMGRIRLEVGE